MSSIAASENRTTSFTMIRQHSVRLPMLKHIRRRSSGGAGSGADIKRRKTETVATARFSDDGECGTGKPCDPFHIPLRAEPNSSGCLHCPSDTCECVWIGEVLSAGYQMLNTKRETQRYHRSDLCAKSILPPFVSRLVRLSQLADDEVFYDFGCGNGSVVFQVATMTRRKCVGVEINPTNARVAQEAWAALRPTLEEHCGCALDVQIICADVCALLRDESFFQGPCVVWAANLLLPKPVNHFLSERLRTVPIGTRIFCLEDLYPHSRRVAELRDPDAFARFTMEDYTWPPSSVEWCDLEGPFYKYTRK